MADENTNGEANANAAKAPKAKTVFEDFPDRSIFTSTELAANFITDSLSTYTDFGDHPIVSPVDATREGGPVAGFGLTEEGGFVFDPEIFPENMNVVVAKLVNRANQAKGREAKVKAIVIYPVPRIEDVIADPKAMEWLSDQYMTQAHATAVRKLRDTDKATTDLSDVTLLAQMPRTLNDYITSSRGATSTLLEAYQEYWKDVRDTIGNIKPQGRGWALAKLSQKEMQRGLSSADYAARTYPTLENADLGGGTRGSLFVLALEILIGMAEENGKDTSVFREWQNTRDEYVIDIEDEAEEGEEVAPLSAASLLASIKTKAEPEATATVEPAESEPVEEPAAE